MILRTRDKVALGVVAVVLVIIAYYFIAFAPQRSKLSELNASIVSQQQALADDQTMYQQGRAAEVSLRKNRASWKALQRAIPQTADIPELLRVLQKSAAAAHVKLQSISLSPDTETDMAAAYSADTTGVTTTSTGAAAPTTVPLSLTFSGSYVNLEQLMHELDTLVVISGQHVSGAGPLVSVGSISLSGRPVTASLTASIYQLAAPAGTSTTAAIP